MADLYPDWMGPQGEGTGTTVVADGGGDGGYSLDSARIILQSLGELKPRKPRVLLKHTDNYKYNSGPIIKIKLREE